MLICLPCQPIERLNLNPVEWFVLSSWWLSSVCLSVSLAFNLICFALNTKGGRRKNLILLLWTLFGLRKIDCSERQQVA